MTPKEYLRNLKRRNVPPDTLVSKKDSRARLTTEHKVFISSYVRRNQSRKLKATEVRDELHCAFGETTVSYFSLTTIRIAMKRMGFSYRKSSVRPPF